LQLTIYSIASTKQDFSFYPDFFEMDDLVQMLYRDVLNLGSLSLTWVQAGWATSTFHAIEEHSHEKVVRRYGLRSGHDALSFAKIRSLYNSKRHITS
jgi:hypothetical protein